MLKPVPIEFGEWRPDMAPHMSPPGRSGERASGGGCLCAVSRPCAARRHGPAERAKGFFPTILPNGSPIIYAATKSAIYRIANGSLVSAYDASPASVPRWWFAQVGGKLCAGCDGLRPVGGPLGSALTPLGGSPPLRRSGRW
jgi:hypothetical protein